MPAPRPDPGKAPRAVCVVGASAGGLDALQQFFAEVPVPNDVAWLVVQHLSPEHRSLMPELLGRHTPMPVHHATDGEPLVAGQVYLNSPKRQVLVRGGRLSVEPHVHAEGTLHLPIDATFGSLAETAEERAIGVVLSGTGSDGTRGAREIKSVGGSVFVQSPEEAQFDGMPRSVIATGLADRVLPAAELPAVVLALVDRGVSPVARDVVSGPITSDASITRLLGLVRERFGTDFSEYKPETVLRRIERRVAMHAGLDLADYVRYCRESPDELQQLYRDLLINVTRFFRDGAAFDVLEDRVIPRLLEETPADRELRLWVPGCSTGEEPYSLVMLLLEAMTRRGERRRIRVFATDIDTGAIEIASMGRYSESIAADVGPERLARFFVRHGDGYRVTREVRDCVIFARHNLLKDPPLTRMDFVSCRNLLIYLGSEAQRRALALLGYALRRGGVLFLGASESPGAMSELFETLDVKWKLFRAVHGGRQSPTDLLPSRLRRGDAPTSFGPPRGSAPAADAPGGSLLEAVQQELSAVLELRAIVVDEHGTLLHVFGDTRDLLRVPAGRPALNAWQLLPRPAASAARAALARSLRERRPVVFGAVQLEEDTPPLSIHVRPLSATSADGALFAVLFVPAEVAAMAGGDEPYDAPAEQRSRIEQLERELAATRENLQATVEELETSNEELQATNEELLASNEELQSANEELQSVNEELQTVNAEYQEKIDELVALNGDFEHLMRATGVGSVFVDRTLNIRKFTEAATSLLSIMPQDVGRPIGHLTTSAKGLDLAAIAGRVVTSGASETHDLRLEDGTAFQLRALPYRAERGTDGAVLSFIDVTAQRRLHDRLQAVLDALPASVAVVDARGTIVQVNAAWQRFAAANDGPPALAAGAGLDYVAVTRAAGGEDAEAAAIADGIEAVLAGEREAFAWRYPCHAPGQRRFFQVQVMPLPGETLRGAVILHVDVTDAITGLERAAAWIEAVRALDVPGLAERLPEEPALPL